jgi:N-methylhydantoinase A
MVQAFHAEHKRRYGYSSPEREVEIVTIRLRARIRGSLVRPTKNATSAPVSSKNKFATSRDSLQGGRKYRGPAIITEYSATTVVPANATFELDRNINLLIKLPSK